VVTEFAKSNEALQIKGGFLNTEIISVDDVTSLSKLPSREVLIAKVIGQMKAPINNFVGVLSGQIRNLVFTLKAIEEKKQEVKNND
jgi:large subunit ribosomal protein L10